MSRTQLTENDLIAGARLLAEDLREIPGTEDWRARDDYPGLDPIYSRFGSWTTFLKECGLKGHGEETGPEYFQRLKDSISCANCDENRNPTLDFHHIHEKETTVGRLQHSSPIRIYLEVLKCVPLCANCHRLHHNDHEFNAEELEPPDYPRPNAINPDE